MGGTAGGIGLKGKLFGFVAIASFLVLAVVGAGTIYYLRIEAANRIKNEVGTIVGKVLAARVAEKTYLQFFTPELKKQFDDMTQDIGRQMNGLMQKNLRAAWMNHIRTMGTEFERYPKVFEELVTVHSRQNALKAEMVKPLQMSEKLLVAIVDELIQKQTMLRMDGENLTASDLGMLNVVRDCRTAFIQLQAFQLQYMMTGDERFVDAYRKMATGEVQELLETLEQNAVATKKENSIHTAATVRNSLKKFVEFNEESQKLFKIETGLAASLNQVGERIIDAAASLSSQADQDIAAQQRSAVSFISAIVLTGLIGFWVLSFFLVRSIIGPIQFVISGLAESSEQVASSAVQISSAGQQMAEGASEQAASIEETCASIEELAAMTRHNADSADHANRLMTESKGTITRTNQSMERLTVSMREISKASQETQKIVQTIDEIAFQTNLLALNAAVEAARAGEAGAGFAVVADEVRNLSRRAAEAARNTSMLIETTVKTILEGADLAAHTNREFNDVLASAGKVEELVGEIAVASREQAQGIEQVSHAVTDMDKVIQQNAANAEESAASSEEMKNRSEEMKEFVAELAALVGGKTGGRPPLYGERRRKTDGLLPYAEVSGDGSPEPE